MLVDITVQMEHMLTVITVQGQMRILMTIIPTQAQVIQTVMDITNRTILEVVAHQTGTFLVIMILDIVTRSQFITQGIDIKIIANFTKTLAPAHCSESKLIFYPEAFLL